MAHHIQLAHDADAAPPASEVHDVVASDVIANWARNWERQIRKDAAAPPENGRPGQPLPSRPDSPKTEQMH